LELVFWIDNWQRHCVGIHLAKSTLWLAVASILAVFNVGKAKDEHGKDIEISYEPLDGFITSVN
jgi:hypothetical protein